MVKIKRRQTGVFLLQKLCVLLDATQRWGRCKQKTKAKTLVCLVGMSGLGDRGEQGLRSKRYADPHL